MSTLEIECGPSVATGAEFIIKKSHGFDRGEHLMVETTDGKFVLILDVFLPQFASIGIILKEGMILRAHLILESVDAPTQ